MIITQKLPEDTIQAGSRYKDGERNMMEKSLFEKVLESLGIEYKRTRPYSPWQNGVVERSHKIDNEIFYSRRRFRSEEEMYKAFNLIDMQVESII